MDIIPPEVFLNLVEYLEPNDLVALQRVNRRFLLLARDSGLWRMKCFDYSGYLTVVRRREALLTPLNPSSNLSPEDCFAQSKNDPDYIHFLGDKLGSNCKRERTRILANWEPSYPSEKVDWYGEFIARNAPIFISWLQQPQSMENLQKHYLEIKGMGIYEDQAGDGETNEKTFVVGPVEDGSVCLWDIRDQDSENENKKGSMVARSREKLLAFDLDRGNSSSTHTKMVHTAITECMSVDSRASRAYFAVGNGLIEIDLETLSKIRHDIFPFAISALSEAKYPVPLTVGTKQSLHLFDTRVRTLHSQTEPNAERFDFYSYNMNYGSRGSTESANVQGLLNPICNSLQSYHVPGHVPGALSILHLPNSRDYCSDIYVAGRFPSILIYDRRIFPKLGWTIHSGARLSSLEWLPHTFASEERDLARYGKLSISQVQQSKTRPGKTLIACGEYNSKGSLEMYGLSSNMNPSNVLNCPTDTLCHSIKNRQTSSNSKLLAVANHGTRIVVSDGGGNIKWLERDGFTLSRCWNIAPKSAEAPRGIFGSQQPFDVYSGSADVVTKILNISNIHNHSINCTIGDLALLTGEKIGLLSFSSQSKFVQKLEVMVEEMDMAINERIYAERMGRALVENADEVRWMRNLGLGPNLVQRS